MTSPRSGRARAALLATTVATVGGLVAPWASPSATAAEDDPVLVSVRVPDAAPGTSGSVYGARISADGRSALLTSSAKDLIDAPTTSTAENLFLRDLQHETTRLVTERIDGGYVAYAGFGDLSRNGRYVSFQSADPNIVADPAPGYSIYVKDTVTADVERVTVGPDGAPGNGFSAVSALSADGRTIAFVSNSTNLVPGPIAPSNSAYVRDLETGLTTLVSINAEGTPFTVDEGYVDISDDGTLIAFATTSSVVAEDQDGGAMDVYLHDTVTGSTELGSVAPGDQQFDRYATQYLSGNGRYLLFHGTPGTFVRDLVHGTTETIQPGSDIYAGAIAISDSGRFVSYRRTTGTPTFTSYVFDRATDQVVLTLPATTVAGFTADARHVLGSTDTALDPLDTNTQPDAYLFATGVSERLTAPVLTGTPAAATADTSPTFEIAPAPGSSLECSLSTADEDFQPCTSPVEYGEQPRGTYTFEVRASDAFGNASPTTEYEFSIGPDVVIDSAPAAVSDDSTPEFAFSSEAGATFECSLTNGPASFQPCTSPHTYPEQVDGDYTFRVRVADADGNRGATASHAFTLDTRPPDTTPPATIITAMPDTVTTDDTPTLEFRADEDDVTFECSLSTGADDYRPCASPHTYAQQDQGDYTFRVRATDPAGNTGEPVTVRFTIDTGPTVSLDSAPADPTNDSTPTFGFVVSEPDTTVECSLTADEPEYQPCTSPISYPVQPDGEVTFRVRATDQSGDTGPPTIYTFTIDATAPAVSIDQAPGDVTDDSTPTFAFSTDGSDGEVTFECSLSGGADDYQPCTSPATYGPLADSGYAFKVRAIDELGNVGEPTVYAFVVDAVQVAAPSTPDLTAESDTGTSNTDDITSDTTPTFTGTAQPGTTVTIYAGGLPRGSAITDGGGTYEVTTSTLPLGTYQVTAVATGAGGETSPASGSLTVQIVADTAPTACATATNPINGTNAANTIRGNAQANLINALGGNDTVTALGGNDCVHAGTGNDDVKGNAGADELNGDAGNDQLFGNAGDDLLGGGDGNDVLRGNVGADELYGGVGADELFGNVGADTLNGGEGNDILRGGAGQDTMLGGAGVDRIYAVDGAVDIIDCGPGAGEIATVDVDDIVTGCETVRRR